MKVYVGGNERYIGHMLRVAKRYIIVGGIALLACGAQSAAAQAAAYVPLDDNAYVYADALIARGRLRALSQVERPYRVSDFQRAMQLDTALGSPRVQQLYDALSKAIVKYDISELTDGKEGLKYAVVPYLVATEQTSGIRELTLADSTTRFRPGFGGIGIVQAGPLVVAARAYEDPRLKDDPEFLGQKNRSYVGRMEDAYLSAQFKYGEAFIGRMGRNWGPPQLDGLLLGHYAYTYDHVYVKLGVPALTLSTVFTRLDDKIRRVGTQVDSANRYFSVHQLALNVGNFAASVSEAVVYSGPTETFRLAYINPVTPYILTQVLEKIPGNVIYGLDLAYRSKFGNFSAQGALDDVAKDNCGPGCEKPNSYAFTFGAEGIPLWQDQKLFAYYTLVANLTYRNTDWSSHYTSQNVGLGRGYSDYEEVRVGTDLLVIPGAPLKAYFSRRRQGEGDYRQPHPVVADYPITEQFLQGVVQETYRFGVSGAADIARYAQVTGDLGYNRVNNSQHTIGVKKSSFEGRIKVTIESPWKLVGAFAAD